MLKQEHCFSIFQFVYFLFRLGKAEKLLHLVFTLRPDTIIVDMKGKMKFGIIKEGTTLREILD